MSLLRMSTFNSALIYSKVQCVLMVGEKSPEANEIQIDCFLVQRLTDDTGH